MAPSGFRLAHDVDRLLEAADGRALPLSRAMAVLDDRGHALAVFFLTLPFVMPMPTLGLALPVGAFLALAGLGVAIGRPPALPVSLQRVAVAHGALSRLASVLALVRRLAGRAFRPRLSFLVHGPMRVPLGLSLCAASLVLALPLPLPMSNFFPALAILMLSAGLIEGDGLLVAAGHAATVGVGVGLYLASDVVWTGVRHVLGRMIF
jgi:hypothetical protein